MTSPIKAGKQKQALSLLYFDGKPVAYLFGLTVANQYHAIDTAYLDEFKKNSPGTLVNLYLLQDLFDDHCVRYVNEGYDPYKSRYIADVWDTFQVFLFSNSVRAKLAYAAKFKLQPLLEQSQNGENS